MITHIVFDFDGTCTQILPIRDAYLAEVRRILEAEVSPLFTPARWADACARTVAAAPKAAWHIGRAPSAPAAADPYILAFEAAQLVIAEEHIAKPAPADAHARAVAVAEAPFRESLRPLLTALATRTDASAAPLTIAFVSNSSTQLINKRLDHLLGDAPAVRGAVKVFGDAQKFVVDELSWSAHASLPQTSPELRARFDALPATTLDAAGRPAFVDGRPVYTRRGRYFETLAKVWGNSAAHIESTLVIGDVYELDLALPAALGCHVHLIERDAAFPTYPYERAATAAAGARGAKSADLDAVLQRL